MIQLPRRSVTRFFIPLIDVLTLLFCIFLLMPLVQGSGEAAAEEDRLAREEQLRALELELATLRNQGSDIPPALREDLERLRREKIQTLQERLAIRVLEIDPGTGRLYYQTPDQRLEVRNQADAEALIDRDREALKGTKGELYYLIMNPRDRSSPYPLVGQRRQYDAWFKDVAHGYDIPGTSPSTGGKS